MDGRTVVVLRVSEFQETPLIVTSDLQYQDGGSHNKLAARAGEMLIRTGAAQTTTIRSADDMRALMRRSLLKTREVLLFGIRELLNAEALTAPGPSDIHAAAREQWSKRVGEWTRKVGGCAHPCGRNGSLLRTCRRKSPPSAICPVAS